jgi:hypothetical protein
LVEIINRPDLDPAAEHVPEMGAGMHRCDFDGLAHIGRIDHEKRSERFLRRRVRTVLEFHLITRGPQRLETAQSNLPWLFISSKLRYENRRFYPGISDTTQKPDKASCGRTTLEVEAKDDQGATLPV